MRNEFPSPSLRAAVAVAAFLAASCTAAGVRERIWRSGGDDDMTIHCLGNGSALFYGRGPEFAFVYGPGYSNPSFGEMKLESGARLEARTWRVDGRNEWRHEISSAGGVAEIDDALDPEFDVLKRRIRTDIPLSFRFHTRPQAKLRWYKSYPCAGAARGVVMALVQGNPRVGTRRSSCPLHSNNPVYALGYLLPARLFARTRNLDVVRPKGS